MIKKVTYCGERTFGELIKEQRIKQGLSLREVSEMSGVSRAALSRWETGQRVPSIETFNKVMAALGAELYVMDK